MENNELLEMEERAQKALANLEPVAVMLAEGVYETRDISVEEFCTVSDSLDAIAQYIGAPKNEVLGCDKETQETCMSSVTEIIRDIKKNW